MQTVVPTFLILSGEAIDGPYTAGQLRVLEERGEINGETQIARHGEAEWLPLEVWREVIHGAPTHRGPIPGVSSQRARAKAASSSGAANALVKVGLIVALIGVAMILLDLSVEDAGGRIAGIGTLGVGLILWMVGGCRR